ncbi:hypothetical protein [Lentiprolixibacter aurantiacus]|uniref:Uncharacterized protein n=1 Tax=Lentiprolixibacter aurantiacus TaxID=2993939 RepID=A0AAE3MIT2_9FLAO|nr:hypothetical protein [Lentiprolixibacter aurantiacus]MCX2718570.1 hypothetical protein [Lentiprolixibacter aurantiacus]
MTRKALIFLLQLIIALLLVGVLHYGVLYAREWPISVPNIFWAYLLNLVLAAGIYLAMLQFAARQSRYLGFLFMVGSALKFAAYFVILEPVFSRDGSLSRVEFFYFFVPYITCLVAETMALVKLLRDIDLPDNS